MKLHTRSGFRRCKNVTKCHKPLKLSGIIGKMYSYMSVVIFRKYNDKNRPVAKDELIKWVEIWEKSFLKPFNNLLKPPNMAN